MSRLLLLSVVLLSACGTDIEDPRSIAELKAASENLAYAAKSMQLKDQNFDKRMQRLSEYSEGLSDATIKNQKLIASEIDAVRNEHKLLMQVFKEFDAKVDKLEALYISEGTIELTGADGKINMSRFPTGASAKCFFSEEFADKRDATAPHHRTRFSGSIQTQGEWEINGVTYNLNDRVTARVQSEERQAKDGGTFFKRIIAATFKNTRGELVSSERMEGYLLSESGQQRIPFQVREKNGKTQYFIPKGTKCSLVLTKPFNFDVRI
ncbi:MAG: hypothetical protein KZQ58_04420 [gamma proteobacterium symbiont of Bathyaustriella thionipta]|nr:hypothetical protein [gamma proteobacterium symbiont of Bathyaustriella thionipta]